MSKLEKNMIIPLEITALSHEGNGLGRYEGQVVFVPTTAVGDVLEVQITALQRNHALGVVESIQKPSPERQENDCPSFPDCGGCSFRHLRYEKECEHKRGFLADNLERIGKLTPVLDEFLPSPIRERYRNKVQLPLRNIEGKTVFGFFAPRSHRLIATEDCLLQPEIFSAMAQELCDFMDHHKIPAYDDQEHRGLVRHLYLREAGKTGELMASVVINGKEIPHWEELLKRWQRIAPALSTLLLNHNTKKTNVVTGDKNTVLYGNGVITDEILGIQLELSPDSFYQINYGATEHLYAQALDYADPQSTDVLVDLYCGVGAIGLLMANRVKQVIGIEIVPEAVENAKKNAKINGIENTEFICADATKAAEKLMNQGLRPQIVVVDPPRKGVDGKALQAICSMKPEKILYISCDSATLARDCALLAAEGYAITRGRGVDLFPRTPHVEAVILLEKR